MVVKSKLHKSFMIFRKPLNRHIVLKLHELCSQIQVHPLVQTSQRLSSNPEVSSGTRHNLHDIGRFHIWFWIGSGFVVVYRVHGRLVCIEGHSAGMKLMRISGQTVACTCIHKCLLIVLRLSSSGLDSSV